MEQHLGKGRKPAPHVPQGGPSKDSGPGLRRRPSLNVSVSRRGGRGGLGAGGPQALRGPLQKSLSLLGARGLLGCPACLLVLLPTLISTAKALKPPLLMPGFKIPESKIHVQSVIRADF